MRKLKRLAAVGEIGIAVAGAFFFRDDRGDCARSRTGGAPRGWCVLAQTAIAGSRTEQAAMEKEQAIQ